MSRSRRVPYRPIQYLGWVGPYRTLRRWGLNHQSAANIAAHWWTNKSWVEVEKKFVEGEEFQQLLAVCDIRLASSGRLRLDEERKVVLGEKLPQDEVLALEELQGEFAAALERDLAEFVLRQYRLRLGPLTQTQEQAKGRKSRPKA